jgi:tripartite-type tricarboxylate transporter receptor subunit TctC
MSMHWLARGSSIVALSLAIQPGHAETFDATICPEIFRESRITVAVPNAVGGGYDTYGRSFAATLEGVTGATVRVSNLPGGGGVAALIRVAKSRPEELAVLVAGALDVISTVEQNRDLALSPEDLTIIGLIHSEPEAWIGRPGLDLIADVNDPLVASTSSVVADYVNIGMVSLATGHQVQFVGGYAGSSDMVASILRGETDITSKSLATSLRAAQSGDVDLLLVLTDAPHPEVPEAPYLAGEGGLVAALSAGLSEDQQAERQRIARIASTVSRTNRGLFINTQMQSTARSCLEAATATAITSEAFQASLAAQGRGVSPLTGSDATAVFAAQIAAYRDAAPVIAEVARAFGE